MIRRENSSGSSSTAASTQQRNPRQQSRRALIGRGDSSGRENTMISSINMNASIKSIERGRLDAYLDHQFESRRLLVSSVSGRSRGATTRSSATRSNASSLHASSSTGSRFGSLKSSGTSAFGSFHSSGLGSSNTSRSGSSIRSSGRYSSSNTSGSARSEMMKLLSRKNVEKAAMLVIGMIAVFSIIGDELSSPLLYRNLRGRRNLGVKWNHRRKRCSGFTYPKGRNITQNITGYGLDDFYRTLLVGFPSGEKRLIYMQMETLTDFAAKDEWDFQYQGITNHPFIKSNYPHHDGIWGWGDSADQVVLTIRNLHKSLVEYHDIRWDIEYALNYEEAWPNRHKLYKQLPPNNMFQTWRDTKVMDEIYWYGWFIDYWMEGGLLRDVFSHNITTPEHFKVIIDPLLNTRAYIERYYADHVAQGVSNGTIQPSYDPNCVAGRITEGCNPVAIVSAEKLEDGVTGVDETALIANALRRDHKTGQHVVHQNAWGCVWRELVVKKRGLPTIWTRPGFNQNDYNFSEEMLTLMIQELNRLINKYPGTRVAELLVEHRALIQTELNEVASGVRKLTERDFLGPIERERRGLIDPNENRTQFFSFFEDLRTKVFLQKHKKRQEEMMFETKKQIDAAVEAGDTQEFLQVIQRAKKQVGVMMASGKTSHFSAVELFKYIDGMAAMARSRFASMP